MVRFLAIAAALSVGCARNAGRPPSAGLDSERPDVDAARELDQQGVRSFREARYADAIAFFRAARAFGGPSSELWNIARCQERLDSAEEASETLRQYLTQGDITSVDRAEAEREARALRSRTATLTIATAPGGASVTFDGRGVRGATPLSIEVTPGPHALIVGRVGYAPRSLPLIAKFGRAIIVSLSLSRQDH